jgi:hypothetical protein
LLYSRTFKSIIQKLINLQASNSTNYRLRIPAGWQFINDFRALKEFVVSRA